MTASSPHEYLTIYIVAGRVKEADLAAVPLLIAIQTSAALEIFVGGEQEAARAARRIHDDLAGPRLHAVTIDVWDGLNTKAARSIPRPVWPAVAMKLELRRPTGHSCCEPRTTA